MTIHVTQEHIDKGLKSCGGCPIALALRDAGFNDVVVFQRRFIYDARRGSPSHTLPPEAREFIEKFDKGRTVQPFSFELEAQP
jgi:hypothetical protein